MHVHMCKVKNILYILTPHSILTHAVLLIKGSPLACKTKFILVYDTIDTPYRWRNNYPSFNLCPPAFVSWPPHVNGVIYRSQNKSDLTVDARMRTETYLNESEIDLNECEHFLKANLRSDRSKSKAIWMHACEPRSI